MTFDLPRITKDLILISHIAGNQRKNTLINDGAAAQLTGTTIAYLKNLRSCGRGPKSFEAMGQVWYVLSDLQDWVGMVVNFDRDTRHV